MSHRYETPLLTLAIAQPLLFADVEFAHVGYTLALRKKRGGISCLVP